jgi:colanic acid/amylovoran biosynthesis glycosyltransferase
MRWRRLEHRHPGAARDGDGAIAEQAAEDHAQAAPPMKIAYLCALYPAVSHTFVLREVDALRGLGAEIATFSIRRASSDHLLAHADRVAFESTYAILPPRWTALLATHLKLAASAPMAYLSTLALALRLAPAGLRGRLWQAFYFVEAVDLWKECDRRGVRHIHVHMGNVAADVALLTAHLGSKLEPGRPWSWSFTLHGPAELFDVSHFRLAEKLQRALLVVCISDYTRSQLMALSHPETWERLHVVHVGIPIEQFTPAGNGSSPKGEATILFIGRHVPEKGHAVLLEAMVLLAERGQIVNLILAGDGPSRPTLERLAKRLGVASRVSFPGAVGQEDIHALYAGASIFCLPSFAEGVPGVLMEAMAMRLPVVSTRITGIPELIEEGRTGLLVSPGRPDELADALEQLLIDPALRREMGLSAREKVVRAFNVDRSAEQLYALFASQLSPVSHGDGIESPVDMGPECSLATGLRG